MFREFLLSHSDPKYENNASKSVRHSDLEAMEFHSDI